MKVVSQLNSAGYFTGATYADESPLEPGVYLFPGGTIDVEPPAVPLNHVARWDFDNLSWVFTPNPTEFLPEKPYVPRQVTMRQARLALLSAGKLAAVTAAIATLPSPTKEAVEIEWEYSQTVERERPFVAMLGAALDLDDRKLDDLFILANTL